jgi:uncharacterized protein (TIGR02271 family)
MTLHNIKDFNPEYKEHFGGREIKGIDLYVGNEKVGAIDDILVDDGGQFRYLIISTGGWILGKKVLLPIGRAQIQSDGKRAYANALTKAQVEALPAFTNDMMVDYDHEEQVRGVYRSSTTQSAPSSNGAPKADYDRNSYAYDKEPDLYDLNEQNHPNLKLYGERLVAGKTRQKTGEAVIGKRVETETAQASVAVEKERVTIERIPSNSEKAVAVGEATFQAGEVARMDVYEEVPEFHKEAFVREEVRVNKVVDRETVKAQETIRREELDVDTKGSPVVKNNN